MMRRIYELPEAKSIPGPNELIVPVFEDGTDNVLYQISVQKLIDAIVAGVTNDHSIEMRQTETGIKFVRLIT